MNNNYVESNVNDSLYSYDELVDFMFNQINDKIKESSSRLQSKTKINTFRLNLEHEMYKELYQDIIKKSNMIEFKEMSKDKTLQLYNKAIKQVRLKLHQQEQEYKLKDLKEKSKLEYERNQKKLKDNKQKNKQNTKSAIKVEKHKEILPLKNEKNTQSRGEQESKRLLKVFFENNLYDSAMIRGKGIIYNKRKKELEEIIEKVKKLDSKHKFIEKGEDVYKFAIKQFEYNYKHRDTLTKIINSKNNVGDVCYDKMKNMIYKLEEANHKKNNSEDDKFFYSYF